IESNETQWGGGVNWNKKVGNVLSSLKGKSTKEKVNLLEPYVRSLPTAMTVWVLDDVVKKMVGTAAFGPASSLACGEIGNISKLIASILPIPFARENTPDPTLCIYIDMNPSSTLYGSSRAAGIQSIEFYINAQKTVTGSTVTIDKTNVVATGSHITTYSNHGVKYNQNNLGKIYGNNASEIITTLDTELNRGTTDGTNLQGWDYFVLRIGPNGSSPMVDFMEAQSVEETTIGEQVSTPPSEIIVTDIATREATADGRKITLNEKYLEDKSIFPQKAKVNWVGGYDSVGNANPGNANYLGGTTIIWDASTIDFRAAELTSDGRYLAGYVYGYVLDKVMYAIPVYTTTTHAMTNVYAYKKNGSSFTQTAINIDINSQSNKYNPAMPDLMRIKFQGGKTYTFGTVLEDVNGDKLYALAKGTPKLADGKVNVLGTSYKLEYAYVAGLMYDVASASDVETFNAGGLTIGLFEKQGNRYVQVAQGSAVSGNTYYKVQTEEADDGVEYVKLDYSKLPTGSNFPVGWVKYDEYTFDWAGGAVDVSFEYQWGFSAIHE
ncbi:MAG: hypothetical protein J6U74_05885, partial [Clostridia bacterium]|nr:hypothetical protein [Clostridia bacterium]